MEQCWKGEENHDEEDSIPATDGREITNAIYSEAPPRPFFFSNKKTQ